LQITWFKIVVESRDTNQNIDYSVVEIFLGMIIAVRLIVSVRDG